MRCRGFKSRRPDWSENQPCNEFRCGAVSSPTTPCTCIRRPSTTQLLGGVSCPIESRRSLSLLKRDVPTVAGSQCGELLRRKWHGAFALGHGRVPKVSRHFRLGEQEYDGQGLRASVLETDACVRGDVDRSARCDDGFA